MHTRSTYNRTYLKQSSKQWYAV